MGQRQLVSNKYIHFIVGSCKKYQLHQKMVQIRINCSELKFLQKTQWAHMSISPPHPGVELGGSKNCHFWNIIRGMIKKESVTSHACGWQHSIISQSSVRGERAVHSLSFMPKTKAIVAVGDFIALCISVVKNRLYKTGYTLFANNDEKRTNGRNPCEMRIVCREWFVRFMSISRKSFSQNAFTGVGSFLTNWNNFFYPIFCFYTCLRKLGSMTNSV